MAEHMRCPFCGETTSSETAAFYRHLGTHDVGDLFAWMRRDNPGLASIVFAAVAIALIVLGAVVAAAVWG